MKTKLVPVSVLLVFTPATCFADSATWNVNPSSSDWNTAANWTPARVPNGPTDVATFDSSNKSYVSVSATTEVDSILFNPGAVAFTIDETPFFPFTISGAGIINNSGVTQQFVADRGTGAPVLVRERIVSHPAHCSFKRSCPSCRTRHTSSP